MQRIKTLFLGLLILAISACNAGRAPSTDPTPTNTAPTATSIPATLITTQAVEKPEDDGDNATPPPSLAPISAPLTVAHPENLSAGDSYAPELGNQGYDVQTYDLTLSLDPSITFIDGAVHIEALSTQNALTQVSLDLIGFQIDTLAVNDIPANYLRQGSKLVIALPQALNSGDPFSLNIEWSGAPDQTPSIYAPFEPYIGMHFVPESNSLYTLAEPDGARFWFPTNGHPRDKALFTFDITVPQGLTAVANGTLDQIQEGVPSDYLASGIGDRFLWSHKYPMAPYLATINVAEYVHIEDVSPNGVPLQYFIFPEDLEQFNRISGDMGEMIDWMSDMFGEYPFESFGFVTIDGAGASLETQTMVILSNQMLREMVLAHELAHMWFGDVVALERWGDMWRNEGFATYFGHLWEDRDNVEDFELKLASFEQIVNDNNSQYPINNPPPGKLFGSDSYLKGALMVAELRQTLGDDAFFTALQHYFELYRYEDATHDQFQDALEESSGQSLDAFFAKWFNE